MTTPSPVERLVDYGPAIDAAIAKAKCLNISPTSIDTPEMIGRLIAAEVLKVATPAVAAAEGKRIADGAERLAVKLTRPALGVGGAAEVDVVRLDQLLQLIRKDSSE